MLKSENARLSGWVYVDVRGRDLSSVVHDMQHAVAAAGQAAARLFAVSWSGQFEYLERATERLKLVVPVTLADHLRAALSAISVDVDAALLIMATLPFALVGGFWLVLVARALHLGRDSGRLHRAGRRRRRIRRRHARVPEAGVGARACRRRARRRSRPCSTAIREGAVLRVRPKAMTVAVVIAGLLPIMWGSGTGSEVMQRIAAPMVGGMVTAPLLSMLVIPAAWYLVRRRQLRALQPRRGLEPAAVF